MSPMLKKVIEEVKALSAEDRRKLQAEIQAMNNGPSKTMTEEELLRKMEAEGVLRRATRPLPDFTPVLCKGKPVSETIIEERR